MPLSCSDLDGGLDKERCIELEEVGAGGEDGNAYNEDVLFSCSLAIALLRLFL